MPSSNGDEDQRSAPLLQPLENSQLVSSKPTPQVTNHANMAGTIHKLPKELKREIIGYAVLEDRPIRLNNPTIYAPDSDNDYDEEMTDDEDGGVMGNIPDDPNDSGMLDSRDRNEVFSLSNQWAEFEMPKFINLYGPKDPWVREVREQYFRVNTFTILLMDLENVNRDTEHEAFGVMAVHDYLFEIYNKGFRFNTVLKNKTVSPKLEIKVLNGISNTGIQIDELIKLAGLLSLLGFSKAQTSLNVGRRIALRDENEYTVLRNSVIIQLYEKALATGFLCTTEDDVWGNYFLDYTVIALVKGGKNTPIFKAMFEQHQEVPESAMPLSDDEDSEDEH